jgi:hypothetical protein
MDRRKRPNGKSVKRIQIKALPIVINLQCLIASRRKFPPEL